MGAFQGSDIIKQVKLLIVIDVGVFQGSDIVKQVKLLTVIDVGVFQGSDHEGSDDEVVFTSKEKKKKTPKPDKPSSSVSCFS